ncbi:NAD(P)H-binding protein [Streptomyces flavofungini]|uniref:NAD(P)H-binding protein n=1 Tax=Streptomyces flavofungini TaxID=68200 RepID=A0ABS0X312_9ACTN|nr:NAD(P)H-binding protein [Streptomyces flavofungini]MBJ3807548.1 NAD(P)H-binding protein [Streptomyces flavofungini]GHC64870.1 nucleotide-diphosphate-sugar epimerase [Streptomyces flavofungini]
MIVVTGATGNVGRALVSQLAADQLPVRALTRDPARAQLPDGVEVVRFAGPDEPAALAAQFEGATALFLHLAAGGDGAPALLAAARDGGVKHVVVLSSIIVDYDDATEHPLHVAHSRLERQVRESGLGWTALRPGAFSTNSLQWAPQVRAGDTVRWPFVGAVSSPIHEADVAAVAAVALRDPAGHTGAVHSLTGPANVTALDQIHAVGRAVGRELRVEEIAPEEVPASMFAHVPPEMLPALLRSLGESVSSDPELTTTVRDVTGRPARTFAEWAGDHVADYRA